MNKGPSSLRFDTREIAVVFSLFIFVSLLMFTVGILVGKGLAQARYEAMLVAASQRAASVAKADAAEDRALEETVASTARPASPMVPLVSALAENPKAPEPKADRAAAPAKVETAKAGPTPAPAKNGAKKPSLAAMGAPVPQVPPSASQPESFPSGKFTVQVGSYPTEKDAVERVQALKKLGFPYAYFSAKQLGDQKETWYRVWLGFYPDFDSAKKSGERLQERGEVRNYLVRKADAAG